MNVIVYSRLVAMSVLLFAPSLAAQSIKVGVQSAGGVVSKDEEPPDPSYARLLSPTEFTRSDVDSRRQTMKAWAYGSPEGPGPAILPLIRVALQDDDREVRRQAVSTLLRVERSANTARRSGKTITTDPKSDPELFAVLLQALKHPEVSFRREVVTALVGFDVPVTGVVERALFERLSMEAEPQVRARIVFGLTERAKQGSAIARDAVVQALAEDDPDVQLSAVNAMRALRPAEALPVLVQKMNARQSWMRAAVIRALGAFGAALIPYREALVERLKVETDQEVAAELRRVLSTFE